MPCTEPIRLADALLELLGELAQPHLRDDDHLDPRRRPRYH